MNAVGGLGRLTLALLHLKLVGAAVCLPLTSQPTTAILLPSANCLVLANTTQSWARRYTGQLLRDFWESFFLFIRYDGSEESTMTLMPFLLPQNAVLEAGLVATTRRPWWNCDLFTMDIQRGIGGMNDTHLLSLVYSKWWLTGDQQFSVTLWQSSLKPGSSVLEPLGRPLTELVVEWGLQEIRRIFPKFACFFLPWLKMFTFITVSPLHCHFCSEDDLLYYQSLWIIPLFNRSLIQSTLLAVPLWWFHSSRCAPGPRVRHCCVLPDWNGLGTNG